MDFMTIDKLIKHLQNYKKEYGNIPIIMGLFNEEIDNRVIFPIIFSCVIEMHKDDTGESQLCVMLTDSVVEADETDLIV